MKRSIVLICLLIALPLAALLLLLAVRAAHPAITIERNLTYSHAGTSELQMDVAMPKAGVGPFPTLLFLYGGGWRAGNRQKMNLFIEGAARQGYVGAAIDYRLVPVAHFPAQIDDCKAAVRWLRANAARYRIDKERIGVVGFSAGGHLACLLGATRKTDGLEGNGGSPDQSSAVQAVVSFFGPTDFTTRDWSPDLEKNVIVPFLGGSFADEPDVYRRASPLRYVTKDAPPFLFIHGTADPLVPVDQSYRMAKKLKECGVSAQVLVFNGEGHGFSDAHNHEAFGKMLAFLNAHLKPREATVP